MTDLEYLALEVGVLDPPPPPAREWAAAFLVCALMTTVLILAGVTTWPLS